ncbi:MAG: TolC family protein [Rickettsiales bacterium]|nr:TolC family protein [Rickettsiales bacterium]
MGKIFGFMMGFALLADVIPAYAGKTTPPLRGTPPQEGNLDNCAGMTELPGKITAADAVELGLCRNNGTRAAYESVRAAKFQKYQGYSSYLPSVNAEGRRQWRSDEYFGIQNNPTSTAGLTASWLLFDFGKRESDLGAAIAAWNAAGFDYDSTIQTFVYDIISAYYTALMAAADEKVNRDLLKVAEHSFNTADKKFKAGVVPKADRLKAETQLAQKRVDLQKSEGATKIAKGRLLNMMSFEASLDIKLDDTTPEPELEARDIEGLIETAKNLRPDLRAARENVNSADYKMYASYLKNLPSVSASANQDYDVDNDLKSSSISIRVSMPLFAGFSNFNATRAARAQRDQSEFRERSLSRSVERDVWDAFQNYNTALAVLESTRSLLSSARESERVVSGMYNVGRSTMLDWLTAQSDLASAERQAVYARYDLIIKKHALALAIGEVER